MCLIFHAHFPSKQCYTYLRTLQLLPDFNNCLRFTTFNCLSLLTSFLQWGHCRQSTNTDGSRPLTSIWALNLHLTSCLPFCLFIPPPSICTNLSQLADQSLTFLTYFINSAFQISWLNPQVGRLQVCRFTTV